jgi:DNA repair protein RadC
MEAQASVYRYTLKRVKVGGIREGELASGPAEVATFLRSIGLHEEEQEHLVALSLDSKNNVRGYTTVSVGLVDQALAHPREVFRNAILSGATGVIIGHQHPSGDPTPSADDLRLTRNIKQAGDIIGIRLLDHIILAGDRHLSFQEEGLL